MEKDQPVSLHVEPHCIEITWFYRRGDADEIVGSVNEASFRTFAQMRRWVEDEIPARDCGDDLELDYVEMVERGIFVDEEGIPTDLRLVATYEHGPQEWVWHTG